MTENPLFHTPGDVVRPTDAAADDLVDDPAAGEDGGAVDEPTVDRLIAADDAAVRE